MCWSTDNKDGSPQLDSFLARCCRAENLTACESEWLRRVFRVWASVCRCVPMTDMMGYLANLINPVLQVRKKKQNPLCFFLNSLPVIVWSNLSLSSCIEPLFHLKEPLPICNQIFYGCAATQSHYWRKKQSREQHCFDLWPLVDSVIDWPSSGSQRWVVFLKLCLSVNLFIVTLI